jgi:6-pyruvoyltetrahydropterin/6-carboxytetrahydropterin synthase
MSIGNKYELIAGHWLPKVPDGHKCRRPHGHNYEIEVVIAGAVQENGFIIDFYDLDKVVQPLLATLDHTMLNDHEGLENPTAEVISEWFQKRINSALSPDMVCKCVTVWETKNCWAKSEIPEF